jgi:hypothetical protein
MRTLDLGYFEGEKECSVCGQINHYTRDCPKIGNCKLTYEIFFKDKKVATVEARTEYEALKLAQQKLRNEPWYSAGWWMLIAREAKAQDS